MCIYISHRFIVDKYKSKIQIYDLSIAAIYIAITYIFYGEHMFIE